MTVSCNQFVSSDLGTGNLTASYTAASTNKGLLVFIVQTLGSGSDEVTSVDVGGTSLTEAEGSPNSIASGDSCTVYAYFIGSGVPTAGAQTVTATVSGGANKRMGVYVLDGDANLEVVDIDATVAGMAADIAVTLGLGGRDSFCALAQCNGRGSVGNYTPLASWDDGTNNLGLEQDMGSNGSAIYGYTVVGSTDVTAGWTQDATDEACMIAVAVSEVEAAGGATFQAAWARHSTILIQ